MSTVISLREIGRQLDDRASLGRALDELLATRSPALLALGEPTHGIEAFPLLRNDILSHLVDRGYRSIALETDIFAAAVVNDYVTGATADIDTVLTTGFSHGFGTLPANRALVDWLRTHNANRAPADQVRFYGFDAPTEMYSAPSPRHSLATVIDHLPATLRPESVRDLDTLLGDEADWTNQAAAFDPAVSIGDSDRARTLRIVADDLISTLHRAAPGLRHADPAGYDHAVTHARIALGLLRYHAAMASPAPDRVGTMLSLRIEMMADNLLAIHAREQHRGPTLVFAHNTLLWPGGDAVSWASAGALVALTLGERYVFVATDASPDSKPGTFQGLLAEATTRRALFPAPALRTALPPSIGTGDPIVRGHFPLDPAELAGTDAVIFLADTDGERIEYWASL